MPNFFVVRIRSGRYVIGIPNRNRPPLFRVLYPLRWPPLQRVIDGWTGVPLLVGPRLTFMRAVQQEFWVVLGSERPPKPNPREKFYVLFLENTKWVFHVFCSISWERVWAALFILAGPLPIRKCAQGPSNNSRLYALGKR